MSFRDHSPRTRQVRVSVDRTGEPAQDAGRYRVSRRVMLSVALQSLVVLAACAPLPAATPQSAGAQGPVLTRPPTPTALDAAGSCPTTPVVAPTPVPYPGYTEVEPSTGLHVTGEAKLIEIADYRLKIDGKVERPLSLTYEEIVCLPKIRRELELTCPGFFTDRTTYAGPTLASLLALAGPHSSESRVTLTAADGLVMDYEWDDVQDDDTFLAHQWVTPAGALEPIPRSHGFPLRGVFPRRTGGGWLKWVAQIQVS